MKLLIIRHAEPDYVIDSLTEKGWREAQLLSKRLIKENITSFYMSPLGRAQATAKPTLDALGATAEVRDYLREFPALMTYPDGHKAIPWDMKPLFWTEHLELYDSQLWATSFIYGNNDVQEQNDIVCHGLDDILATNGYVRNGHYYTAVNANHNTVALFCHFGVECILLGHLLNISPVLLWHGTVALPSSVTELITEERDKDVAYFRMNKFGDTSHLYCDNEPESFMARFCECYTDETRH